MTNGFVVQGRAQHGEDAQGEHAFLAKRIEWRNASKREERREAYSEVGKGGPCMRGKRGLAQIGRHWGKITHTQTEEAKRGVRRRGRR